MCQILQLLHTKAQWCIVNCEHANIKTFFSLINTDTHMSHYHSWYVTNLLEKIQQEVQLLCPHLRYTVPTASGFGWGLLDTRIKCINKVFSVCHKFPVSLSTSAVLYRCWTQGMLPVRGDTWVQSFPPPRLPCAGRTAAGAPGAPAPHPAAPSGSHPANPSERSGASGFHLPATTKQTKCCHWMLALISSFIF